MAPFYVIALIVHLITKSLTKASIFVMINFNILFVGVQVWGNILKRLVIGKYRYSIKSTVEVVQ